MVGIAEFAALRSGGAIPVPLAGLMRFDYHDSYDHTWEALAHAICVMLLGPTVRKFSTGPDGGRDAFFVGTAERFPSAANPASGHFVVQAKHTEHPFAKFSDPDFSSEDNATSTIETEIPRIKRLVDLGELHHYILFSNRRLGGEAERKIRRRIMDSTGAETVTLFGVESIDDFVKRDPNLLQLAGMSELLSPMRPTPDDFAAVICSLDANKDLFKAPPPPPRRTPFARKNEINSLSDPFAKLIVRDYMEYFKSLEQFLSHPDNDVLVRRYESAALEFNEQLIVHRGDAPFETLLLNLQRLLWQRDGDLARNKPTTKLVLYYMYWRCDLGENSPC